MLIIQSNLENEAERILHRKTADTIGLMWYPLFSSSCDSCSLVVILRIQNFPLLICQEKDILYEL